MSLLERLKQAVASERTAITRVLELLVEAEDARIYLGMAYPSLVQFCVKELGYSEGAAWRRVNASRLMRTDATVGPKIESGELSLMNAAQVQTAIQSAKQQQIGLPAHRLIEAVSGLSSREAEKAIAAVSREFGLEPKEEEPLEEKFRALRAYFSHRNPNPSHNELLHLMADEILGRKGDLKAPVKSPHARYIPEKLRRAIFARDGHQCTFLAQGRRCEGTHFLDVDHIIPIALGGLTKADNLRVLCHAHNLAEARRHGLLKA